MYADYGWYKIIPISRAWIVNAYAMTKMITGMVIIVANMIIIDSFDY